MKFENTEVWGFEHAIRGMRNPLESWNKSDSAYREVENPSDVYAIMSGNYYRIGKNDMELAQKLIKAGSEHRKFMRQIFVSVDITAPLYWWKEFDTYKVGTVANSTSTMHKLSTTPITKDCFECPDLMWTDSIQRLEETRQRYLRTKCKDDWKELIVNLPESWLQKRTVTMNYENLLGMCSKGQRRFHKLTEWSKDFIEWTKSLPYAQEFIFIDEVNNGK